jgi:hypothetical protein
MKSRFLAVAAAVGAFAVLAVPAQAKPQTFKVCQHGCKYRTIQSAVKASGKNDTIKVKPGTYKEAVVVHGHQHDGLSIIGTGKSPGAVTLQGKNTHTKHGLAQNGIEAGSVNNLHVKNMKATNYVANGFFFHDCKGYEMRNLVAAYNRSYGLFAFNCVGGRMTNSVGYGQGDSAYYVGATPFQKNPKWTSLDHLDGHVNVLGYSGTNSKYVNIHDSAFYNNGVGVVPNTLDSEPFEPNGTGIIEHNMIFWNDFNYFLPNSPVKTVSGGLGQIGDLTVNYPTGVGVALFGSDGWKVRENKIFGNFKWGVALFSDPLGNEGHDAVSMNNQITDNTMGRGGSDTNAVDFFSDGSGSFNCFSGNQSSTFDPSPSATNAFLYPSCPAPAPPASGTGSDTGNTDQQFGDLATYVTANPPEKQQCSWTIHAHATIKHYNPLLITPGPSCP